MEHERLARRTQGAVPFSVCPEKQADLKFIAVLLPSRLDL